MEEKLLAELDRTLQRREAAGVLGLKLESESSAFAPPPTLAEYLNNRWASHAALVQNDTTRRSTASHVSYLIYFLGDKPIDEISVADVNQVLEKLHRDGPLSFKMNKDGTLRQRRRTTFTPNAVNRILATLKAVLRLAEAEGVIQKAPKVTLLPNDNSKPLVPPTEDEFCAILKMAERFRDVAPFFPEVIQLAAETGLRESELFHLCWRSVDLSLGDTGGLRIEEQQRSRVIGGKPWKPKYLKFRVVPLTPLARQILDDLRGRVASEPADLVIPNRGGAPYVRIEHAPERSGIGRWHDVLRNCDLYGKVRFHDLRHLFAVRCLQRGVPIAAVSSWLGHSDVNLTVKRYGRWSHEAREQWEWIKKLDKPIDAIAKGPWLSVHKGGRGSSQG